jgi:hypothetical protein
MSNNHGRSAIGKAADGLPKPQPATSDAEPEVETETETEKVRQTLHLPRAVHNQLRDLAYTQRTSQQKLIQHALDLLFVKHGMKPWRELVPKKPLPGAK